MPTEHKVQQGECVASIAYKYGLLPEVVWDDPANAELKELRQNPSVLLADDVLVVPDLRLREETFEVGTKARFRRKGVPDKLIIKLKDVFGEGRSGLAWVLKFPSRPELAEVEGTTDEEGTVEASIPPDVTKAQLVLINEGDQEEIHDLEIRSLDPTTEVTGAQARLKHLGFDVGPTDGDQGEKTTEAIQDFQLEYGLLASGVLDEETQAKLKEIFGS